MPPKGAKGDKGPSKKTEQKKKEKIVEDKTFGLKNKKGAKQQKFIQHVQKQTMQGNIKASKLAELEKQKSESKKDQKKKEADELNLLFRPVEQKISKGADPKSVLCAFFKQGQCGKGAKCKFSHDLNIGRKGEKRNIYEDTEAKETMEDWDEAKLQDVVDKKHGEKNKSLPPTSIICKHFLDAVENSKYGWFWECPGGSKCHYKHALPPGFVLKKDQKKEEKKEEISLEELIEKERAALNSQNLTRVTLESFLKWKQKKREEKKKRAADAKKQKKSDFKQGKIFGISGREMFEFNPDMIQADEGEEGEDALAEFRRKDLDDEDIEEGAEYSGPIREINLEALEGQEMEIDEKLPAQKEQRVPAANGVADDDEEGKLEVAGAITPETGGAAAAAAVNGEVCIDTPIDENLFDGDDIDFVEDELEELELED